VQQDEETSAPDGRKFNGDTVGGALLSACREREHQALRALDLDVLAAQLVDRVVTASRDEEPAADARIELRSQNGRRAGGKQKAGEALRPKPGSEYSLGETAN
jgi:hypothetical protein